MGQYVCNGAMMMCSMGLAPATLLVLPDKRVMENNQPAANIMDNKPLVNIMSFGMCTSLANPAVSSATSAAMGVLTPMPCIPNTTSPWSPGTSNVNIGGQPALTKDCQLMCSYTGSISIQNPGQFTVQHK